MKKYILVVIFMVSTLQVFSQKKSKKLPKKNDSINEVINVVTSYTPTISDAFKVKEIPAPELWDRSPPVRFRAHIPDAWLEISIQEGRNRQVRRMTAAVGLPTLRLVRMTIGDWQLGDLKPGQYLRQSAESSK